MLDHPRSTQRYEPIPAVDERALTDEIVELAGRFGRYGYRRVTALLRHRGWHVNHKRVERIWRREGLKVPARQPKRGRLWLNDGSCVRLRPEWKDHVWRMTSCRLGPMTAGCTSVDDHGCVQQGVSGDQGRPQHEVCRCDRGALPS